MARKKIILLGCGGFVGSHLTDRLLARGDYEIEGWDIQTSKIEQHLENPNLRMHASYVDDKTTFPELEPHIADADAVVSLAAVCNPSQYVSNPVFTIHSNFIHAYKLVELCAKHRKWLVHTSTCEVYGRMRDTASFPPRLLRDPRIVVPGLERGLDGLGLRQRGGLDPRRGPDKQIHGCLALPCLESELADRRGPVGHHRARKGLDG